MRRIAITLDVPDDWPWIEHPPAELVVQDETGDDVVFAAHSGQRGIGVNRKVTYVGVVGS